VRKKVFVDEGLWGMKCVSAALPPCAIYILQLLNLLFRVAGDMDF
jgi:hypothetical protein